MAAVCLTAVLALPGCGLLAPAPPPPAPVPAPAPPPPPAKPVPPPVPQDARPRVERLNSGPPNHAYEIKGERYEPENSDVPMVETGLASWYGKPFHGRRTASGEVYDMNAMTAAHKTMPLPSYALVRNPANGRQVVVKVNDRGPFIKGRVIDLSRAAARKLRIAGVGPVEVRRLTHDEIKSGTWKMPVERVAKAP
jgi:rare lipoprotein A